MFEDYLRSILVKYLTNIIEDADQQQIELAIGSGSFKLNDVKMKPSFLDDLARPFPFPISFHKATIRELHIALNTHTWAAITSHPLHIHIEGVRVWAEADVYDELIGVDSAYVQKQLQNAVHAKLSKLASEHETATADKSNESSGGPSVILARLISTALASTQFELHDLHVCLSIPGVGLHPGATFGIALERADLVTTDEEYRVDVNQSILSKLWPNTYKRFSVSNFSVYFNPDARAPELSEENTDTEAVKMHPPPPRSREAAAGENLPSSPLVSAKEVNAADNHFILYPSSLLLTLKYNKNAVPTVTGDMVLKSEALPISLTRPQYVTLMHLKDVVTTRSGQVSEFIKKLPQKEVTPHQRKRYIFLYKRTLNALWLPELSDYERKEMETLETELPLSDLSLLRRATRAELRRELAGREDVQDRGKAIDSRVHWYDKLFVGSDQAKKNVQAKAKPGRELTEGQKTAILEHEQQQSDRVKDEEPNALFSADDLLKTLNLDLTVKVAVDQVSLELWDEKDKDVPTQDKTDSMSTEESRRDVNKRADAAVAKEQTMMQSQPNAARTVAHSMHNVKPLTRININFIQLNAIILPDNEIKLEAGVHSLSALDLTSMTSDAAAREFMYIGALDNVDIGGAAQQSSTFDFSKGQSTGGVFDAPTIAAPFSSNLITNSQFSSNTSTLQVPAGKPQAASPLASPKLQHEEHAEAQQEDRESIASAKSELQNANLDPIEHKEQVREKVLDDQYNILKSPNIHSASTTDLRQKKDTDLSSTIAPEASGLWISLHRAPESAAKSSGVETISKTVGAIVFGEGDKDQSTAPADMTKSSGSQPEPIQMISKSGHRNTAGVQLDAAKKFSGTQVRTNVDIDLLHTHIAFSHVLTKLPDFFAGPPNAYTETEKKPSNLPIVTDPYVPADKEDGDKSFDLTTAVKEVGGSDKDYEHLHPDAKPMNESMKQKVGTVAPADKAVDRLLGEDGVNKSTSGTSTSAHSSTRSGDIQPKPFEKVLRPTSTSAPQREEMISPSGSSSSSVPSTEKGKSEADVTVQGEDDAVDLDALIANLPASEVIEEKMKTDSTLSLLSFFSPISLDLHVNDPIIQFTPELSNQTIGLHITVNLGAQAFVDTIGNRLQAEAAITNLKILAGESIITDARYLQMPKSGWKLSSDDLTLTVDQPFLNALTFINGPASTMGQKLQFLHDHLQMIVKQNVFFINVKQ